MIVIHLFSSVLLVLTFAFLYSQYRERHMLYWTLAWLCHTLRILFDYLKQNGLAPGIIEHLVQGSVLLAGLLLLAGTAQFVRKPVARGWLLLAAALLGWDVAVHVLEFAPAWGALPIFLFHGAMTLWTGWLLVREKGGSTAGRLTGWLLILWGLHKLDYPFLRDQPAMVAWGFLLGAFFAVSVALCILLAYFQKVRDKLRRGQTQLQSILDHVDNAVMALDASFRVTLVNRRYLDLWQLDPAFLASRPTIGEVITEVCRIGLYPLDEVEHLIARRMEQLEGALQLAVLETPRLDGMIVEGFAARLPDGGFLLTFRDVTRQQRAEAELQRSREHLRTLVETVPHGILECDLQGRVTFVNQTYVRMQEQIFGGELVGRSIFELIGDTQSRSAAQNSFARHLREGNEHGTELVRNCDRDEQNLWHQLDWAVRRNAAGVIESFIAVVTDVTERIRNEEQAVSAHTALRRILQDAPLAITALDKEGKVTVWNRAAEHLFGWEQSEVLGGGLGFLQMPADQQQLFARLLTSARNGQTVRGELTMLPRQGGTREVALSAGALAGIEGPAEEVVLVIEDISEQRRIELALRHSEETYRNLVEASPVAVFVHIDGYLVFLNPAAVGLFGASTAAELEGRAVAEFLDAADRQRFQQGVSELALDGQRINRLAICITPIHGTKREVEATFLGINYNGCEARLAICLDVTEHKRSESELRAQAEFMQTILDTIPAPIFYKDDAGIYLGCNRAFAEFIGKPREEIVGGTVFDVSPPQLAAIYYQADRHLLEQGGTQVYETTVESSAGERREVLFTKAVYTREDDTIGGLVGTMLDISERKRTEAALRDSERKYRAIFDQAFQFSALLDPQGRLLEANRSALEFAGVSGEELRGRYFWETPWWASMPEYQQRLRAAIERGADGYSTRFEVLNRGRGGRELWIDFSLRPVRDEAGAVVYLIPEGRDITARKRSEELTLLVARGVSAETGEGFFRSLTRSLAKALGADYAFVGEIDDGRVQVVAGVGHGQELIPFDYALAGTPCAKLTDGGTVCTYSAGVTGRFPNDKLLVEMQVEGYAGSPLLDSVGKPLGILVVLFTKPIEETGLVESLLRIFASRAAAELERRRSERVLETNEARYRQLSHEFETVFNGIPDSLTVWTPQLQLVWANRASGDHYRLPAEELLGKNCRDICRLNTCLEESCEVQRCFSSGRAEDHVRPTPDGRSWGIKTFPLRDESGHLVRVIRLASDISERVRLREEAARASHLAALGELAAGVAHEINNPTGLILLDLPLIRAAVHDARPLLEAHYREHGDFLLAGLDYSLLRDQLPQLLDEVLDGAQRIKHIVDELKDFARPFDPRQFVAVDLCEVVRKAVQLVGNQLKKATEHFEVHCATPSPQVAGNVQRLEQVVINLLLNACQSLPSRDRAISVTVRSADDGVHQLIVVRDEGIGIRPEHLAQVTDPFFTTRREDGGTGLGLSVSTRIVEEHGGTLHFASQPGQGTVVTISLPKLTEEPT